MARDEGFQVADTATDKLYDPKFRKLWRQCRDEVVMNAALALHDGVQLASWAAGQRVTAEDGAPFWMSDIAAPLAALKKADLFDDEGRIPEHAWLSWFEPARKRRQQRRDNGNLGGRPPNRPPTDKEPDANRSVTGRGAENNPVRPSVPSDKPSFAGARANGAPRLVEDKPWVLMTAQEKREKEQHDLEETTRLVQERQEALGNG